ncbi:MAG: hypothetical protein R3A52_29045 [Polyangiales bacterium]
MTRAALAAALCLAACSSSPSPAPDASVTDASSDVPADAPTGPSSPLMDFAGTAFWSAPFPSEHRRGAGGRVDLSALPNPGDVDFVNQMTALGSDDAGGFGLASAVHFPMSGGVDPAGLPDLRGSVEPTSTVGLVSVGEGAPDRLRRYPVTARFEADGGPYGAENLLTLLPLQGAPLRPNTLYAAYLRAGLHDAEGRPLRASPALDALRGSGAVPGLSAEATTAYRAALAALAEGGVDVSTLVGLAVFRTGDPTAGLVAARAQVLGGALPSPTAPFAPAEVFDDYCVYRSTIRMPVFQQGDPPFTMRGGTWARGADGRLVMQREEEAALWVTIPRAPMPAEGYPLVVFVRTGGGGDRPLIDRGVHAMAGVASAPGTGPARQIARANVAGISVDGPHGGLRNVTNGDEQFLVFNITNPGALRDNIRQSALELSILANVVQDLRVDASACPGSGASSARFDTRTLALMGHSTGSTIGSIAVAIEPRFRAAVLSGAGGSFVMNLVYKERPLAVRPLAETILRYTGIGRRLTEHDVAANLAQWVGEPADPPVYARLVTREPAAGTAPRHVLMFQGIVDRYILPPIANALSLSLGVSPAGPERDRPDPRLAAYTPVRDLISLVGSRSVDLPVRANLDGVTAALVQQPGDEVEDGHEMVFQTDPARRQYRCFFESLQRGAPRVPGDGALDAPCE